MLSCATDTLVTFVKNLFITPFLFLLLLTLIDTPDRAWVQHGQSAAADVHIKNMP